jgi:predicted AAA+ superfamily ATPase
MTFRNSSDAGLLLENMVFMHLRRNNFDVEYVNTGQGYETDFFARHKITNKVELIQVCWTMSDITTFDREVEGLVSAMDELSVASGTIVTWDDETVIDDTIKVVPVWKWLLL